MKNVHLDQCTSTQEYLLDALKNDSNIDLVSTERQTNGHGRSSKSWHQFKNTLCFSFTCTPTEPLTLTSPELGVLIANFFNENYQTNLKVKWPNDIMTADGKKCGGIIIHNSSSKLVAGVGINMAPSIEDQTVDTSYPYGHVLDSSAEDFENLSKKIYQYILDNRLDYISIKKNWNTLCSHLDSNVEILDDSKVLNGIFRGMGNSGEALIEIEHNIKKIYNGTLRIKN